MQPVQGDGLAGLTNPGAHGLSTMHYEFVSASAGMAADPRVG